MLCEICEKRTLEDEYQTNKLKSANIFNYILFDLGFTSHRHSIALLVKADHSGEGQVV
jgi:hypothetical protein